MLTSAEILVPVDFSPCSVNALRVAIAMAAPEGDLTLLHVIDQHFVDDAVAAGLGTEEEIRNRLRDQAETNFTGMLDGVETGAVDVEKMIVAGAPFVEFFKIAHDLDLPLICIGIRGLSNPPERNIFGATAGQALCWSHP